MKQTYNNYLKTNHWQAKRKSFLGQEQNQKCKICGSVLNLQIHHRRYTSRKGNNHLFHEPFSILMTLCNNCHTTWHLCMGKQVMGAKFITRINNLIKLGATPEVAIKNCKNTY